MSKKIKDATYDLVGNKVVLTLADGTVKERELKIGEGAYAAAYSLYHTRGERIRSNDGRYTIGNFSYMYINKHLDVYNQSGEVIATFDGELKYPRNKAIDLVLRTLK